MAPALLKAATKPPSSKPFVRRCAPQSGSGSQPIAIPRLARDGDPEPVHIEENDTSFVIDWKGNYRIEGPAFIYSDRQTRRVSTILGYPTHLLAPPS